VYRDERTAARLNAGMPGREFKAATSKSTVAVGSTTAVGSITIEEIEAVKSLVDRIGAEKVEKLAKVFAK
jgi:hypothetical protein